MHFSDFWLRCTSLPFITCLVVDPPSCPDLQLQYIPGSQSPSFPSPNSFIYHHHQTPRGRARSFILCDISFFSCPFLLILPSLLSFGLVYLVIYDKLVSDLSVFCLFKSKLDYTFWISWTWFRAAAFQKWVKYIFISYFRGVNFALLNIRVDLNSLMLYT